MIYVILCALLYVSGVIFVILDNKNLLGCYGGAYKHENKNSDT